MDVLLNHWQLVLILAMFVVYAYVRGYVRRAWFSLVQEIHCGKPAPHPSSRS